jgi:GntR family transcriptional regulator of vanillate catabolism
MRKPQTNTQTFKALDELRARIMRGRLNGGDRLREVQLSGDLGISRTPLREALLQLEQEGLLVRGRGGYTVRSFSLADVFDAIELRGVLEGTAARMAAERLKGPAALNDIKQTLRDLDSVLERGQADRYDELNTKFHMQLAQLCGSFIVEEEVQRANRFPFAAPSAFPTQIEKTDRFLASLVVGQQHHHDIVDAIENNQGSRAEHLAREHARLANRNVEIAYADKQRDAEKVPQLALVDG